MNPIVAVIIPNYNMWEKCDALVDAIIHRSNWPVQICVVDNASDLQPPSRHTTVQLEKNVQTTGAWLEGLKWLAEGETKPFAYWFLITSAEIPEGGDPLYPMAQWLADNKDAVGVHPALTADSTTGWEHLITRGGSEPRRTWMIDNIASLYRADWFDSIGWFDPRFTYGWGIDLETCWKARFQKKSLWVDERCRVKKITNIGYMMNRMNMSADERSRKAGDSMREGLFDKYGPSYWSMMTEAEVRDEWK
jgi:hypothetical protein